MAPAQANRLIRFIVAVAHRLDHMARRIAAGPAGGAVGNRGRARLTQALHTRLRPFGARRVRSCPNSLMPPRLLPGAPTSPSPAGGSIQEKLTAMHGER